MTVQAQDILRAFDLLPDNDKQEVAVELMRRARVVDTEPLSDEELIMSAETIFLSLDRREAGDA